MTKPRSTSRRFQRKYAKREARRIYRYMDETMSCLLELADVFQEQHPPEAQMLSVCAKVVLEAQKMLARWYAHVWGSEPSDWYAKT